MSMFRILALLLGLAVAAFAVKYALEDRTHTSGTSLSEPGRQLDAVRAKAREIEAEQQRSADRADVPQ